MTTLIECVRVVLYSLIGAWCVSGSIDSFKCGRYFLGALDAFLAFWGVVTIAKILV